MTRDHFVYRAFDVAGEPLYVGCTGNLSQRRAGHRSTSEWWQYAVRFELTGPLPKEAAYALEKAEISRLRPHFNSLPEHALVVKRRAKRLNEVKQAMRVAAGVGHGVENIDQLVQIAKAADAVIAPEFDQRASHLGRIAAYETHIARRAAA